jgi:hypothetical protein
MKTYFLERCTGGAKNVNFWKTVKPFFSKKCNSCCDFLYIGNKTYVFCIWLLLIHCSYTEVDFYRVVYFDIHYIHCVLHIFLSFRTKSTQFCFLKNSIPSLVDVVLTNQKNQYFNIQNVLNGISDCHNIISVTIKGDVPVQKRKIYVTSILELYLVQHFFCFLLNFFNDLWYCSSITCKGDNS